MLDLQFRICDLRVLAAAVLLLTVTAVGGQTLEICSNEAIRGSEVRMKDIVRFPADLPEDWGDRKIMSSPEPGKSMQYSIAAVATSLQEYPDMHDVTVRGPLRLTIARDSAVLDEVRLTRAVEEYVRTSDQWEGQSPEVRCSPPADTVTIPPGEVSLKVTGFTRQNETDLYTFDVAVTVDGTYTSKVTVSARVMTMAKVWVAAKTLSRGHTLASEDIMLQTLPHDSTGSLIPADEPVVGLEINRSVIANQPLRRHFVVQPICAKRGDVVDVAVARGSLHVTMRAEALATGRKGERILCMNEHSKRRLLVRLTGTREAKLDF